MPKVVNLKAVYEVSGESAVPELAQAVRGGAHASVERLLDRGMELRIDVNAVVLKDGIWSATDAASSAQGVNTISEFLYRSTAARAFIDPGIAQTLVAQSVALDAGLMLLRCPPKVVRTAFLDISGRQACATILLDATVGRTGRVIVSRHLDICVVPDASIFRGECSVVLGRDFLSSHALEYDGPAGTWRIKATGLLRKDDSDESVFEGDDWPPRRRR